MYKGNLRRHVSVRRTAQMQVNEWAYSRVPWSSNTNPKRSGRRWNGSGTTPCECRNSGRGHRQFDGTWATPCEQIAEVRHVGKRLMEESDECGHDSQTDPRTHL